MKIVQFIPSLNSGGAERFVIDLSNSLASNHKVHLFTLLDINEYGFYKNDLSDNVEIISLNKKLGVDLLLPFKIFRELFKIKPDIVHSHLNAIFYLIISFLFLRKTNFFHTIHNDAPKEAKSKFQFYFKFFLFKNSFVYPITISNSSAKGFKEFYGLASIKIYNGRLINSKDQYRNDSFLNKFKKTKETKVFVNVARLSTQKNQIMLAKAFNILVNEGYDISLLIIGQKLDLEICTKIKLISKDIHLLGQVSNPLDYIANSDIFCLSSLYEGMPISLIECFGLGIIPVCTPVGGMKDMIVDGKNGFLSNDISLKSYVVALEKCLCLSDDEICKMKKNSKKEYQNYSMETCTKKHELVYHENKIHLT